MGTKRRSQGWKGDIEGRRKMIVSEISDVNWDVPACMHAQSLQLCPTLCNPMDCSPPASSVHGILQARILEWVAISSSRGFS